MPRRIRSFKYFATLILLCGMLMPSSPSNAFQLPDWIQKNFWHLRQMREPVPKDIWSYQTHLATDTWGVMAHGVSSPKVMDSRTEDWVRSVMEKNETAACVGEISGV